MNAKRGMSVYLFCSMYDTEIESIFAFGIKDVYVRHFFVGKLLIVIIDCLYLLYIRFKNILIKKIEAMKRLKKTTLETGVKVLDDLEMKSVTGGYDVTHFGKYYYCYCRNNAAKPPYRASWSGWYLNNASAEESLAQKCVSGGTCYISGSGY